MLYYGSVLTRIEVAKALRRLEPQTAKNLTSLALWRHEQRGLAFGAEVRGGRARFYSKEDLLMWRLYFRLLREGAKAWVARAASLYLEPRIRVVLQPETPYVVELRGTVGELVHVSDLKSSWVVHVALADLYEGLAPAIRAATRARPRDPDNDPLLWIGHRFEKSETVATSLTRV